VTCAAEVVQVPALVVIVAKYLRELGIGVGDTLEVNNLHVRDGGRDFDVLKTLAIHEQADDLH
jgi:hypothetical protein